MVPYIYTHFGNPSSSHAYGAVAKKAVDTARIQVSSLINCDPDELIFTSCGTESNNYAIKGYALAHKSHGNEIISSTIEHPAVSEVLKYLESSHGFKVTYIPVDSSGLVSLSILQQSITPQTILCTIMHSNNEVGTLQPIQKISKILKESSSNPFLAFHTDCAQSLGKVAVDVRELGVDMLTVVGHKLYAPKGVGALYVRRGVKLEKQMHGADHEGQMRAGTENVINIVGLGTACEASRRDLEKNKRNLEQRRDELEKGLREEMERLGVGLRLNGHREERLPNTLNVSFEGIKANALLAMISKEVAASAGAACHSDHVKISPIIAAMNVPMNYAMGTVRFSTGRETTQEDITRAVKVISNSVAELMKK
eukprot:TRINITY_DN22195_c0_g1_i1.p1 TRINITY_DN22195_c0_g1~~TRINITY_DN22195_c0_g1_i1.p1  ORF type:complete len:403 (+),score=98.24 TRINITY_DN22195_c0_g1_i1:108-1211(+)